MRSILRVFGGFLLGFFIVGCVCVSNDAYQTSFQWRRKGIEAMEQARFFQAQEYLQRAKDKWPPRLADSSDFGAVHANLGRAFAARQEFDQAVIEFESGRNIFEKKKSSCSHPSLAVLLNNFCDSRMGQQKWIEAQTVCMAAFKANIKRPPEKVFPEVPPEDIAWGLHHWAVAGIHAGSAYYCGAVEAELEQYRCELGPEKISDVYFQLGRLSLFRGDADDAEQLHRRSLDDRVKAYGWLHPYVADSLAAIGQCALGQGRFSVAEKYELDASNVRKLMTESDPADIARSLLGSGFALEAQGKLREALDLYGQAASACKSALAGSVAGPWRRPWGRCPGARNAKSPEAYYIAVAGCRSAIEDQMRLTALSLHGTGRILVRLTPPALAGGFDESALALRASLLGPRHPLTLQSHLAVARSLEIQGNYADARAHYLRALGIAETAFGPDHQIAGISLYRLGRVARLQGQTDDADLFYKSAVGILQKEFPSGGVVTDSYVDELQGNMERAYWIDELQGPGSRTTIAKDPPRLPRDHQLLSEFLEKKHREVLAVLEPGQKPEIVFKRIINMIDDPFDDFKHEVQGMNLFGYRVFWPEGFMKGAGDPCK